MQNRKNVKRSSRRFSRHRSTGGFQEALKEKGKDLYIALKESESDIRREMERVEPENTEQQDLADQWKELCELSMPEGEKVLEAVKNFLEYEESCGKVLKKESEELKKQSETLRMLIQKKAEKNKIFDRLEMEEKQLSILNAKQEEMEPVGFRQCLDTGQSRRDIWKCRLFEQRNPCGRYREKSSRLLYGRRNRKRNF